MRWETSRPLLVLYNGCSSKRTDNSRKTFQTESRTQVGDRAGSLVGLLELESREESIRTCALPSPSLSTKPTQRAKLCVLGLTSTR